MIKPNKAQSDLWQSQDLQLLARQSRSGCLIQLFHSTVETVPPSSPLSFSNSFIMVLMYRGRVFFFFWIMFTLEKCNFQTEVDSSVFPYLSLLTSKDFPVVSRLAVSPHCQLI